MKHVSVVVLVIISIVLFIGCSRDEGLEIVGIVTETVDGGGFMIEVIDGYQEDAMHVHVDKKTKTDDTVSADVEVGSVVGLMISDEVMESYPVQATAQRIMWVEPIIRGEILSAGPTSLLIMVTEGFAEDLMQVHLTEATVFYKNIPSDMDKNMVIGLTITGEIMESSPVQVFAKRILVYK